MPTLASISITADGAIAIGSVHEGSFAGQAGVQTGDVIELLDGQVAPRFLGRWLNQQTPGDTVKLRLRRAGQEREVAFALGSRSETVFRVAGIAQCYGKAAPYSRRTLARHDRLEIPGPLPLGNRSMLRTAIVAITLTLFVLIAGPVLLLYTWHRRETRLNVLGPVRRAYS